MAKLLKYDDEARRALEAGVNKLADTVALRFILDRYRIT